MPGQYEYDLKNNKVVKSCTLRPTEVYDGMYWLWAKNNKYENESIDSSKVGKWMLFPTKAEADDIWNKIKESIEKGHLWHAKISISDHSKPRGTHAVMIYTRDYSNLEDVVNVLDYLEKSGIKHTPIIYYKADYQTHAGIYAKRGQKASLYSSKDVRSKLLSTKQ